MKYNIMDNIYPCFILDQEAPYRIVQEEVFDQNMNVLAKIMLLLLYNKIVQLQIQEIKHIFLAKEKYDVLFKRILLFQIQL